ncbi:MAG: hypothetical protein IPK94_07780 [Saprospiraceae bacterium]|nr:hypothetical protein [Saprospiraceae bacterium]
MDYSYIAFNGWGIVNGRWVYISIWDPSSTNTLSNELLIIIVINHHLRFIKNPLAIEALKKISNENAQKVASGLSTFDTESDSICSPITWPPKKPIFPAWTDNPALPPSIELTEYERVYAKNMIMQLGIQLKDTSIQDAAALI